MCDRLKASHMTGPPSENNTSLSFSPSPSLSLSLSLSPSLSLSLRLWKSCLCCGQWTLTNSFHRSRAEQSRGREGKRIVTAGSTSWIHLHSLKQTANQCLPHNSPGSPCILSF